MPTRRASIGALVGCGCAPMARAAAPCSLVEGIVWQPSATSLDPEGSWDLLGASTLLVQWTEVDAISFAPTGGARMAGRPDWSRIAGRPWARHVIVGLAGRYDGRAARAHLAALVRASERLVRTFGRTHPPLRTGAPALNIAGWYFPVEVDPTWPNPHRIGRALAALRRPLWISVFDNSNIGPREFASWLASWLPLDVGVFFQDGVGLYKRQPETALQYFSALARTLGPPRAKLIAEVFRAEPSRGRLRPATPAELLPQLRLYAGRPVFLFEGPHYLPDQAVHELVSLLCGGRQTPGRAR